MAQRADDDARAARKAAKKQAKADKRAKREGTLASGSKDCDLCQLPKDMLIRCVPCLAGREPPAVSGAPGAGVGLLPRAAWLCRCMVDESRAWRMVCTKCWPGVSGGVEDGDEDHPHYRYGGIWKNKSASSTVQSAKKPKGAGSGAPASP